MGKPPKRRKPVKNTAIAYIRVSTDKSRQENGAEVQRAQIEAWALRAGVTIIDWRDDEVSGGAALEARTGLLEAIALVGEHRAGILVFQKWDRFTRDPRHTAFVELEIERLGATLVAADGVGNGEDPSAQFMKDILLAAGKYEKAMIRARITAALALKKSRGELTGKAPFGFRAISGPTKERRDGTKYVLQLLEKDPAEQATIALARELSEGRSIREVAAELASRGILGRAEKPLTRDAVWKIVRGSENTP